MTLFNKYLNTIIYILQIEQYQSHYRDAVRIIVLVQGRPSSNRNVDKRFTRSIIREDLYCRCILKSPKFSRSL